jgi:hypothetical protein
MNVNRLVVPCAALILLGGLLPARFADDVLVPGNPPLTQGLLEKRLKFLEWMLETQEQPGSASQKIT